MSTTTLARKLVLAEKASNAESIAPAIVPLDLIQPPEGHAVIHVQAAAVNPSDVKAALGMMPHAIWPRTPGRDFAGVVVAGPDEWLGAEVWGTGGDLGMIPGTAGSEGHDRFDERRLRGRLVTAMFTVLVVTTVAAWRRRRMALVAQGT